MIVVSKTHQHFVILVVFFWGWLDFVGGDFHAAPEKDRVLLLAQINFQHQAHSVTPSIASTSSSSRSLLSGRSQTALSPHSPQEVSLRTQSETRNISRPRRRIDNDSDDDLSMFPSSDEEDESSDAAVFGVPSSSTRLLEDDDDQQPSGMGLQGRHVTRLSRTSIVASRSNGRHV